MQQWKLQILPHSWLYMKLELGKRKNVHKFYHHPNYLAATCFPPLTPLPLVFCTRLLLIPTEKIWTLINYNIYYKMYNILSSWQQLQWIMKGTLLFSRCSKAHLCCRQAVVQGRLWWKSRWVACQSHHPCSFFPWQKCFAPSEQIFLYQKFLLWFSKIFNLLSQEMLNQYHTHSINL